MRSLLIVITVFILADFLITGCANIASPTGGAKDTIPPSLIDTYPAHKSTNFQESDVVLIFDENINGDKLKQNLIITPAFESEYDYTIRKNKITIKFENDFEDSTTYTLNFFNGLTDNTEKTPVENLILAFSTGDMIDSLYVSGYVYDLYKQEPSENFMVGLFEINDTLDYFLTKPIYFYKTNKEGYYRIENIKSANYRLLAFKDENGNLTFDADKEAHGFIEDTIKLTESIDSMDVTTINLNVSKIKLMSSRVTGRYFQVRYNKPVNDYRTTLLDSLRNQSVPPNNLNEDMEAIIFYAPPDFSLDKDSIGVVVQAMDTIRSITTDTVYVKFNSSQRNPDEFILRSHVYPNSITNTVTGNIEFSKPVQTFNPQMIYFNADTLFRLYPDSLTKFSWNDKKTELKYTLPFQWNSFSDSLNNLLESQMPSDSLDSVVVEYIPRDFSKVELTFDTATFVSVEYDTLPVNKYILTKYDPGKFGLISVNVNTTNTSYYLELIDKNYKSISKVYNARTHKFTKIKPGSYSLRVFIDDDKNTNWSQGNIYDNIQPESIYIHPEFTDLRANWEITIDISF